jgi:hypothetical protein
MNASRKMARMTTTNQKKNTTIPGIACPATVLALATGHSYPVPPGLFRKPRWDLRLAAGIRAVSGRGRTR